MAADAAGTATMRLWRSLLIPVPYALLDPVRARLAACGGMIEKADYGSDVLLEALVPETEAEAFLLGLAEISAGGIEAETVGRVFRGA
jgi:putative IMPACT (imprinted ancient) family translation regulator